MPIHRGGGGGGGAWIFSGITHFKLKICLVLDSYISYLLSYFIEGEKSPRQQNNEIAKNPLKSTNTNLNNAAFPANAPWHRSYIDLGPG